MSIRFLALAAAGAVVALLHTATLPGFDPTGMIYVDMARHIAAGDGIAGSIYFPSHVPKSPSPIALWPPLYPAAIAGVSLLGIDPGIAARLISVVAFGMSVGLVGVLGSVLFGEAVGLIGAFLLMSWPPVVGIAAMAVSENLFVLFVLVAVLAGVRLIAVPEAVRPYRLAATGGLAMAAATLTRYPGLTLTAVAGAALLLNLRGRAWVDRLTLTAVWSSAALGPPVLLLARNRFVTGTFMGTGRPADDSGLAYHVVYAVKTIGTDALSLIGRLAVMPEVLGFGTGVMALVVLAVGALVLFGLIRSAGVRDALLAALAVPVATPAARFTMVIGFGYWAAMAAVRSVTAFEPLNTRMMMPTYPLVLLGAVAIIASCLERIGMSRRVLAWTLGGLAAAAVAVIVLPQSLAAGGPRLRPDPAPAWVVRIAAHTPPGAPIVGNRSAEVNFYLGRPTYSFQARAVFRAGNRFDRDCPVIARHLAALGWKPAYLVLHAEEGGFDAELMGRRYGPTIERLLKGDLALPVRPVARQPEFAAFEILDLAWKCDGH